MVHDINHTEHNLGQSWETDYGQHRYNSVIALSLEHWSPCLSLIIFRYGALAGTTVHSGGLSNLPTDHDLCRCQCLHCQEVQLSMTFLLLSSSQRTDGSFPQNMCRKHLTQFKLTGKVSKHIHG